MKSILSLVALAIFTAVGQQNLVHVKEYCSAHLTELGLQPTDLNDIRQVSQMSSKRAGAKHIVFQQFVQGLPVLDGRATVTVMNDQVVRISKGFRSIPSQINSERLLNEEQALGAALKHLNIEDSSVLPKKRSVSNGGFIFEKGQISREEIPVRPAFSIVGNELRLTWELSIYPVSQNHWWSIRVDATTGQILRKNDWINACNFDHDHCSSDIHASPSPLAPPPPPGADQYLVYALPLISPNDGNRSLVVNPSDAIYSPFGWHDTDGNMGDEYTITRGNNVYASEDINDDDAPGYSPDGTNALDFNFPYDSLVGVQGNLDAVITNLFYMNNMMHDIWAYYGFDEASGNFQETNYSGNGLGMDYVFADAQDGSGTNNANFGTPPDGSNPRMQMYLWTSANVPDLLTINAPASISGSYNASTAGFGPAVPSTPITEDLVLVLDDGTDPNDGCGVISNGAALNGKIAVVKRGTCTFAAKVENIQTTGAVAVIVVNNTGGAPISMGGSSGIAAIPAIMVSQANGNSFISEMANGPVNGTIVNPGDLTATDSDFDNMVIAHEYGHGISNRLVGGPDNTDCLFNEDQMGEGWSDWFGLMITQKPGDLATDPRGVGTYVTNQPNDGTGIRPAPYSTNPSINDYTYANTNSVLTMPHGIGFVWATMLWDLNWALIDQFGFDQNVKSGTGGNNIAMALVIEGLKLTACGPGFVDGRDGILAADSLLYGGANHCLIWEVFANRGLGYSASQGDPDDRSDAVEAFNLPPECTGSTASLNEVEGNGFKVYPNPTSGNVTVHAAKGKIEHLQLVDMSGKLILELACNSNEESLRIESLKQGMYLLRIQSETGFTTLRIEKK
jgi:hypothetical protein